MAFRSNGPVSFLMPKFNGVTRRLVLSVVAMFVLQFVLNVFASAPQAGLALFLVPRYALGHMPWQLATYAFLANDILSLLFGLYLLWVIGADLEDDRGGTWLTEYWFTTSIGGGLITALLARTSLLHLSAYGAVAGLWAVLIALLMAYARRNPEAEVGLFFVLRTKAKYMAMVFLLINLFWDLLAHDTLGAVNLLACALCGYLFLRFAPRRGLGFAGSEWWYGMRNAYYRSRRRRAAKKFTVYMKQQGKDVSFDESGRYLDPNGVPRDPNDRRWMN